MATGSRNILSFPTPRRTVHRSPALVISGKTYVIEYVSGQALEPRAPGAIVAREEGGPGEFRLVPTQD